MKSLHLFSVMIQKIWSEGYTLEDLAVYNGEDYLAKYWTLRRSVDLRCTRKAS